MKVTSTRSWRTRKTSGKQFNYPSIGGNSRWQSCDMLRLVFGGNIKIKNTYIYLALGYQLSVLKSSLKEWPCLILSFRFDDRGFYTGSKN